MFIRLIRKLMFQIFRMLGGEVQILLPDPTEKENFDDDNE